MLGKGAGDGLPDLWPVTVSGGPRVIRDWMVMVRPSTATGP